MAVTLKGCSRKEEQVEPLLQASSPQAFLLEDNGEQILYDLYCGVGSIGLALRSRV